MTVTTSPIDRTIFSREYAAGLREYVSGSGEAALKIAYELGRKAFLGGVGIMELAMMHHEILGEMLARGHATGEGFMAEAAQFFAEAISTFEMNVRSYQANARLLGLSEVLAKQNAESSRAYQQLRTILDATTAIIYLKDVEGRYLFVNRQFQAAFDVQHNQAIGSTDEEVLPKPVAEVLWRNDRRALSNCKPEELEEILPVNSGQHTYLSLKFPLLSPDGNAHAICCVATDITERQNAAEELRKAKEAAESANQELESFSYSVAHDLRAPLRSINGFSHALLEDCGDRLDAEGKENLEIIIESARHMGHLIDDLLALSRVARGELREERVDLSDMARKIAQQLKAIEPGRQVHFKIQDGLVDRGDAALLRAMLENLIGNAWKFTGKKPAAEIEFGMEAGSSPPIYFVADNGAGFDMAYSEKLFGVFQRLHSAEEFEGTGIGLATVRRIVKRHGGKVWAKAAVNAGATFYFTLREEG